jgi:hypothetical protein
MMRSDMTEKVNVYIHEIMMSVMMRAEKIGKENLPLLEHILRHLDLFGRSSDGDYAIRRAGKCFIDLNESTRLGTYATDSATTFTNDCACHLIEG